MKGDNWRSDEHPGFGRWGVLQGLDLQCRTGKRSTPDSRERTAFSESLTCHAFQHDAHCTAASDAAVLCMQSLRPRCDQQCFGWEHAVILLQNGSVVTSTLPLPAVNSSSGEGAPAPAKAEPLSIPATAIAVAAGEQHRYTLFCAGTRPWQLPLLAFYKNLSCSVLT